MSKTKKSVLLSKNNNNKLPSVGSATAMTARMRGPVFREWSARSAQYRANARRDRKANDWLTGYSDCDAPGWCSFRTLETQRNSSRIHNRSSLEQTSENIFGASSMSGDSMGFVTGISVSKPHLLTSLRVYPRATPVDWYKYGENLPDEHIIGRSDKPPNRMYAMTGIVAENRNKISGSDTMTWYRPDPDRSLEYLHTCKKYPISLLSSANHLYSQIPTECCFKTRPFHVKELTPEASDNKQRNSAENAYLGLTHTHPLIDKEAVWAEIRPDTKKARRNTDMVARLNRISYDWLTNDPNRTDDPTINFVRDKCSFNHAPILPRAAGFGRPVVSKETDAGDDRTKHEEWLVRRAEPVDQKEAVKMDEPVRKVEPLKKEEESGRKEEESVGTEEALSNQSEQFQDAVAMNRQVMDSYLANNQGTDLRKRRIIDTLLPNAQDTEFGKNQMIDTLMANSQPTVKNLASLREKYKFLAASRSTASSSDRDASAISKPTIANARAGDPKHKDTSGAAGTQKIIHASNETYYVNEETVVPSAAVGRTSSRIGKTKFAGGTKSKSADCGAWII